MNRWSILRQFAEKAYHSQSLEEVLAIFPSFLAHLLQCEQVLFFLENQLTGETELKQWFGYSEEQLKTEEKNLQENTTLTGNYLLSSLPQKETFSTYFLLVRGQKDFIAEEEEIFHFSLYQLSLIMKKFSLINQCQKNYLDTIQALARTIDARCDKTKGHSDRVASYAVALAQALGWSGERLEDLRQAAFLHDLGKIGIADSILKKAGGLTEEEMAEMRKHPSYTATILNGVAGLQHILPLAEYHHECYDGSGYPLGLQGKQIPLGARIIAVADAFDAMTAERIYRRAIPIAQAIENIRKGSGSQFDPLVAEAFIELLEKKQINWED